jgi:hypothetical protein
MKAAKPKVTSYIVFDNPRPTLLNLPVTPVTLKENVWKKAYFKIVVTPINIEQEHNPEN